MVSVNPTISIDRSLHTVFAYVSDPRNLPAWSSAVTDVRSAAAPGAFVMTRRLPTGTAVNDLRVVVLDPPARFAIETTSGPTPLHYAFRFRADGRRTTIELDARADLGPVADLLQPLARRGLERGLHDNLETLKRLLERPDVR